MSPLTRRRLGAVAAVMGVLSSSPGAMAQSWVEGPDAAPSQAPLPPAVAPRDGEPGAAPPSEVLVVPPVPPEDVRVDVVNDDAVVDEAEARPFRFTSTVDRRTLSQSSAVDLGSLVDNGLLTGLWWLPSSSGASRPAARGYGAGSVGVVVDGVPLLGDDFGIAVAPTELIAPLAVASMTARLGPQSFTPSFQPLGGVIDVDTGGPMTALGETMRTDGLVAAGTGGPDNETGATAVGRTGWRTLRLIGTGTLATRGDQRPGRLSLGVPPTPQSTDLLRGTGGSGGTLGARVDTAPVDDTRIFVSWLAGRSIDTPDPNGCGVVDTAGRAVDCVRARERGADVFIVGADVSTDVGDGTRILPMARVHLQRGLDVAERAGRGLPSVDLSIDEVFRGGVVLGAVAENSGPLFFDLKPRLEVGLDATADRASSIFATRSLRARDGAPRGDGDVVVGRAKSVDGATARSGGLRARLQLQGQLVGFEASTRLMAQQVESAAVVDGDVVVREAAEAFSVAPSVDVSGRLKLTRGAWLSVSAGSVQTTLRPAVLVQGPGHRDDDVTPLLSLEPGAQGSRDRFVEAGLSMRGAAVDVDATAWGSLRGGDATLDGDSDDSSADSGSDDGAVGVEGRITLKPALQGLAVTGSLQGVAVDDDVFTDKQAPSSAVLQPLARLELRYAPTTTMGVFGRVWGGLPQIRISPSEEEDPVLCPERTAAGAAVADAVCSGVPGFAMVDVGAFVKVGQLRIDVSGENILDVQGAWRQSALGTGGAAVKLRAALVF